VQVLVHLGVLRVVHEAMRAHDAVLELVGVLTVMTSAYSACDVRKEQVRS
jgi:hypothetical protein